MKAEILKAGTVTIVDGEVREVSGWTWKFFPVNCPQRVEKSYYQGTIAGYTIQELINISEGRRRRFI